MQPREFLFALLLHKKDKECHVHRQEAFDTNNRRTRQLCTALLTLHSVALWQVKGWFCSEKNNDIKIPLSYYSRAFSVRAADFYDSCNNIYLKCVIQPKLVLICCTDLLIWVGALGKQRKQSWNSNCVDPTYLCPQFY